MKRELILLCKDKKNASVTYYITNDLYAAVSTEGNIGGTDDTQCMN